ncbi:MAG: TonB-dependent receptor plug domain-containing protein [Bryobacteraceae bacterium]
MRFATAILFATLFAKAQTPEPVKTSIVITASPLQPEVDHRNKEVFERTLFSRDDQVFHLLEAGINAGQHEGGGKSVEIRRFGFNLDHGGVNGGLKVLVDNIQQNQTTQGHGQGYLGALKGLSPELVEETTIVNGPFSPEYGDFSGLGVVHVRLRESLPDQWTARMQGGSFNNKRGFLAFSPDWKNVDSYAAYDGSHSDGPFVKPLDYRRDNVTGNMTRRLARQRSFAVKWSASRNDFSSSGQIPLDEVTAGRMNRFGFLDPGEGGRVRMGTFAGYYRQDFADGSTWKADAFLGRSLFDLFSNFTYFLNDPVNGDGIQQHDSRLQQGANTQYQRPHRVGEGFSMFTAGGNFHANQINVGLYSRVNRNPMDNLTVNHANVANAAGYVQESLTLMTGRLLLQGGARYDLFRFDVRDRLDAAGSASDTSGRWQPKFGAAFTPSRRAPVTLHANYGRGISSIDARSISKNPAGPKIAATDFWQAGVSTRISRVALSGDAFLIQRSNEMVYIADDGSLELYGPSRAYGFETKTSVEITRWLYLSGGVTKVGNAYYREEFPRVYVDRAPHLTANAALTLANWRGWSSSVRMRAINRYGLDGSDAGILAAGHTVWDFSMVRRIRRGVDFQFAIDNVLNRSYWEVQNLVDSRPYRGGAAITGIHGTPGYPRTFTVGLAFRFRGK